MTFDRKLFTDALVAKVRSIIDEANRSGARVAAWEAVQQCLLENKVAWYNQIPPELCGVHPGNRSKLGVGGSEAHHHGAQILQAGFSWQKAADAAAVECPPPPYDEEARTSNEAFVALSDGLIPPLEQLKLLSIGSGHTNTFLRAVKAGCRSAVPKLANAAGKLDLEALSVGRASFRDAVEKGLRWFVLHWQVPMV